MLNIILITFIIVFIIDLSGFITDMEKKLSKWLKIKAVIPKPFSCSLCLSFWTNIIYLISINSFSLPYLAFICLLSFLTPIIQTLLLKLREILEDIILRIN